MTLLQFSYKGTPINPKISYHAEDLALSSDGYRLVSLDLANVLDRTSTSDTFGVILYEVGEFSDESSIEGPLSGATLEETRQAVEILSDFMEKYRTQTDATTIRNIVSSYYQRSDDRVRNALVLLSDHIGNEILYHLLIERMAEAIIGLKKAHMAKKFGY